MKKTKKFLTGFTLIELLVVIAIIGILASIVLVSFPLATKKANDARIITAMSQIRTQAAEYYGTNGNYTGYTVATNLATDIINKGGKAWLFIKTAGDAYCVVSVLNSGGVYCADSAGLIGKATATSSSACASAATAVCPAGTTL